MQGATTSVEEGEGEPTARATKAPEPAGEEKEPWLRIYDTLGTADPMQGRSFHQSANSEVLVHGRYGGAHPRCRPAARPRASRPGGGLADPRRLTFAAILQACVPTLRHVPAAARAAWAQCSPALRRSLSTKTLCLHGRNSAVA